MPSIEEQLRRIMTQKLKSETNRLYNCIQRHIDEYYKSYDPSVYQRTYRFQNAMYAQNFLDVKIIGNIIELAVTFNDNLSMHDSITGGQVYVPVLINYGWCHKGYENYPEDHFHRYNGYHFIERGIADFNRKNNLGVKINVSAVWCGKDVS